MARTFGTKDIKTPEELSKLWDEYIDWTNNNPMRVQDFVGKDGKEVYKLMQRPLTQFRFETWARRKYHVSLGHYFDNKNGAYDDYCAVCSHIVAERTADQIEGGMVGIYNPSITQRLNGLVDRIQEDGSKDVTIKVKYESKRIDDNPQ